jgi:dihydroflavonol-4-reductase
MTKTWTLVTGATGFIGSAVARRLVERGVRVKAFVRPGSNLAPFAGLPSDRFQLAYGDVTIESTVYRALIGCNRLFHVASVFRYWSRRADDILQPALLGTQAVLAAARSQDIERIVVTSSAAVLGVSSDAPMDESHENQLVDPELYIRAKIEADRLVQAAVREGMPIISVLPSGVFGPGDRKPTPNGRTLLDYLKLAPGRHIPATDGGISVVDVDDVAEGHVLAMEKGKLGERYLLGGENVTFRGLFEILHELTGLAEPGGSPSPFLVELAGRVMELKARFSGRDPLLTRRLARDYAFSRVWVSSKKAEQELGYSHRPARETLARAIRWYLVNDYLPQPLASRVRLELRPV